MNTSMITKSLSMFLLAFFAIYSITAMSTAVFLFASSIGLIIFGSYGNIEISVASTIIIGVIFHLIIKAIRNRQLSENFTTQKDAKIIGRIKEMQSGKKNIESFANPSMIEGFTSESTEKAGAADEVENGAPSADKKVEDVSVKSKTQAVPAKTVKADKKDKKEKKSAEKAGFTDKATDVGLFKLGEMPSERKEGPHIDAGTTIMKALSSLKTDDIKRMSNDNQQLLDTQKSLLGMLSTMKPMLSEGQQLLQTFGTMFGNK
jgi:hypothetical protein